MAQKEIACSINAACGDMRYADLRPSATPVRVAIVGGGPAGMEAARIATERGHRVTLFERHDELEADGAAVAPHEVEAFHRERGKLLREAAADLRVVARAA